MDDTTFYIKDQSVTKMFTSHCVNLKYKYCALFHQFGGNIEDGDGGRRRGKLIILRVPSY